jgi:excisionase family DNA binding protein
MSETLLTRKQVAEMLQVGEWALNRWHREGKLPWRKLGNRTVRFAKADVEKFLEQRKG